VPDPCLLPLRALLAARIIIRVSGVRAPPPASEKAPQMRRFFVLSGRLHSVKKGEGATYGATPDGSAVAFVFGPLKSRLYGLARSRRVCPPPEALRRPLRAS
jgi:hypothetical protein